MYFKLCFKCSGDVYIDSDGDLHCMMCGRTVNLKIRRNYDSRTGKIRDNKKAFRGDDVGFDSGLDGREVRSEGSSNLDSTLSRKRTMATRRGILTSRR